MFGIDQQEVRIAVSVVVEEGDAAAHRFRQQALAVGAVLVREADAGKLGNVGEVDGGDVCPRLRRRGGARDLGFFRGRIAFAAPGRQKHRCADDCKQRQGDQRLPDRAADALLSRGGTAHGDSARCRS